MSQQDKKIPRTMSEEERRISEDEWRVLNQEIPWFGGATADSEPNGGGPSTSIHLGSPSHGGPLVSGSQAEIGMDMELFSAQWSNQMRGTEVPQAAFVAHTHSMQMLWPVAAPSMGNWNSYVFESSSMGIYPLRVMPQNGKISYTNYPGVGSRAGGHSNPGGASSVQEDRPYLCCTKTNREDMQEFEKKYKYGGEPRSKYQYRSSRGKYKNYF